MSDLMQKAIAEINKLPEQQQDELAAWILEKIADPALESEADWEARAVRESVGDAIDADGNIDFDKLGARTIRITLDELYPEFDDGETQANS